MTDPDHSGRLPYSQDPAHRDNASVGPEETMLRRIASLADPNLVARDEATGEVRLKSGAFSYDDDGCSTYRRERLEELGLQPLDLIEKPVQAVVALPAARVRDVGLGIRADPQPVPPPYQPAHALLVQNGLSNKGRQQAFSALGRDVTWLHKPT